MSAWAALKRSTSSRILFASMPWTGTGKNSSISVGLAARAALASAAAAGRARAAPSAARRVIGSIRDPLLLDAGEDERSNKPALEEKKKQQRPRDEKCPRRDDAPRRPGLGAGRERGEANGQNLARRRGHRH